MIIGLTGKNGSGKGAVSEYLRSRGFIYLSLSDVLRQELDGRNQEPTRENMLALGNELRAEYGPDVLAQKICETINPHKNYIVDSIRHPDEVACFREFDEFEFWEVQASDDTRFKRMKRRGRVGDPVTLRDFINLEDREAGSSLSSDQQLSETLKCADFRIKNDSTLESLHLFLKRMLDEKLNGKS